MSLPLGRYDVTNPKSLANARDVWLPELVKSTDDEVIENID